jgi:hypothetical protein
MSKSSPIEFYDEELSRTVRQIQQLLLDNADNGCSRRSPDALFVSCRAYLQQMTHEAKHMRHRDEKKQWMEIIQFRSDTLGHLQRTHEQQ